MYSWLKYLKNEKEDLSCRFPGDRVLNVFLFSFPYGAYGDMVFFFSPFV